MLSVFRKSSIVKKNLIEYALVCNFFLSYLYDQDATLKYAIGCPNRMTFREFLRNSQEDCRMQETLYNLEPLMIKSLYKNLLRVISGSNQYILKNNVVELQQFFNQYMDRNPKVLLG